MVDIAPTRETATVVLVGHFNPAILQPRWLANQSLIRPEEAAQAEGDSSLVVSMDLTALRLSWLDLQVLHDRFTATSRDPSHFETLKDCVVGVFELLEFTPVTAMGLNCSLHCPLPGDHTWQELECAIAPKRLWRGVLPGSEEGLPAMKALSVEGHREGSPAEHLNVKVEPSVHVANALYIETNEHFAFAQDTTAVEAANILREHWSEALNHTKRLVASLIEAL